PPSATSGPLPGCPEVDPGGVRDRAKRATAGLRRPAVTTRIVGSAGGFAAVVTRRAGQPFLGVEGGTETGGDILGVRVRRPAVHAPVVRSDGVDVAVVAVPGAGRDQLADD